MAVRGLFRKTLFPLSLVTWLRLFANGVVVGLKMQTKLSRKLFKCRIRSWRPGPCGETTLMVCLCWRGEKMPSIIVFNGVALLLVRMWEEMTLNQWRNDQGNRQPRCLLLFCLLSCCHRNMQLGVSAIVCYLHACRHQNEAKCRKYLARTIWLMTYDDEKVWYEAVYGLLFTR